MLYFEMIFIRVNFISYSFETNMTVVTLVIRLKVNIISFVIP